MRAALVDLDGTLVDTHAANLAAYEQALAETGAAYSDEELRCWVGKLSWREMLGKVLPDRADLHEGIAVRKRAVYPCYFEAVRVNEVLVGCLRGFRNFAPIALVTSASRESVESLLAAKDLARLFDLIVTSDDVAKPKPAPEPYLHAARELAIPIGDCVVFEDSEIGVASGRAAGAQVWQIRWEIQDSPFSNPYVPNLG